MEHYDRISSAHEDYLEAIYCLKKTHAQADGGIRSVDVAQDLGVSKASVNKAITTLKEHGLVQQSHYGHIVLTETGNAYARDIFRSHRALKTFLEKCLGVDTRQADDEACAMEHALSYDTQQRLISYLEKQNLMMDDE